MLAPVLVTGPTVDPVTLEEAKAHLRIGDDEDQLIETLIGAAVRKLDGLSGTLGRAVMTQTWSQEFSGFAGDLVLPLGPVQSITSVVHSGGTFTDYRLLKDDRGWFLRVAEGFSWPTDEGPVTVTFVAGDAEPDKLIHQLVLLLVGSLYAFRESLGDSFETSPVYDDLLDTCRVWGA